MSAIVESDGSVIQLNGRADARRAFTTEDAQDPEKVARSIDELEKASAEQRRTYLGRALVFRDVNCGTGGASIRLQHNFGGRARWSVVSWKQRSSYAAQTKESEPAISFLQFLFGANWSTAAGNFTLGQRVRMKSQRDIYGVRFIWPSAGAGNVKATIYNASTSAVLGTKTVACNYKGPYKAVFDTPISTDLTAVDIFVCVWEASGTSQLYSTSTTFSGAVLELPDYRVTDHTMYKAGDACPDATGGGTYSTMVEPIIGSTDAGWELREYYDATLGSGTDNDTLVLKSWAAGTATICIEEGG